MRPCCAGLHNVDLRWIHRLRHPSRKAAVTRTSHPFVSEAQHARSLQLSSIRSGCQSPRRSVKTYGLGQPRLQLSRLSPSTPPSRYRVALNRRRGVGRPSLDVQKRRHLANFFHREWPSQLGPLVLGPNRDQEHSAAATGEFEIDQSLNAGRPLSGCSLRPGSSRPAVNGYQGSQ